MPIVTIDNIPVYDAIISGDDCGMFRISLVDSPAVMSDFFAFDKNRKQVMYAIESESERMVIGVVMRCDFPIYRYDSVSGKYYIRYKADTIKQMAEKYLLESRQNDVNLDHDDDKVVDGVQMVQYFIKDTAKGINPAGFDEIADGSLFAQFHIVNDDVWEEIKAGTYKGFSLEGVFDLVPEENTDEIRNIVDSLDGKFSKIFNHSNKHKMSKVTKILKAIEAALVSVACGSITTDKGVLSWDGDEDLKEGDAVFTEDEEGNRNPAEDGEYRTEDGKVISVADGRVASITDAEAEVAPTNEEEAKDVEAAEEDAPEEAPAEGMSLEERVNALETLVSKMADWMGIVMVNESGEELMSKALPEQMAAIRKEVAELSKKPLAESAHEEFKKVAEVKPTGNKGLDRFARIMMAGR